MREWECYFHLHWSFFRHHHVFVDFFAPFFLFAHFFCSGKQKKMADCQKNISRRNMKFCMRPFLPKLPIGHVDHRSLRSSGPVIVKPPSCTNGIFLLVLLSIFLIKKKYSEKKSKLLNKKKSNFVGTKIH